MMLNHARSWALILIALVLPQTELLPVVSPVVPHTSSFSQNQNHSSKSSQLQQTEDEKSNPPAALTLSQLIKKYPETFRVRGPRLKQVALTFDDVPDPRFTPQILNILKQKGVKATFFAVGNRAKKHPHILERIKREGHAVGNHSYNHALFNKLTLNEFIDQIERTNRIIKSITGLRPRLLRPPYGEINEEQLRWARKNNYKIVNWNVDSLDWKGLSKEQVKRNILSTVGPGAIILQHGGGGVGTDLQGSINALPEIISELRAKGYTFVTLPDMLGVPEGI
ncbi:polysaccharide deacetylase family protein [Paenibacillus dakarensis]|uniref:polysaccharide deacetylase family protein n=1 Tax=Paenibacillus dakarensis TaxID=1527293 RepID=UPI0006D5927D|nr:polysaccharide deacetylase family protein [Paenibacillus dakarensis]